MESIHEAALNVRSGVYRHYKGPHYLVLGVAMHADNEELMVVYVRLYAREGVPFFVRPLLSFLEPLPADLGGGQRFQFIGITDLTQMSASAESSQD
jgi:hypothetical protein